MNTLLIGGTSGWGANLISTFNGVVDYRDKVLVTGRSNLDLNDGTWVTTLKILLDSEFGGPQYVDRVVIAAYDRRIEQTNVQLNTFETLYSLFKHHPELKLCVIGDMIHHYTPNESLYTSNKRALYNSVMAKARDVQRQCSLLLFEPWSVNIEDQAAERFAHTLLGMGSGEFLCLTHRR